MHYSIKNCKKYLKNCILKKIAYFMQMKIFLLACGNLRGVLVKFKFRKACWADSELHSETRLRCNAF